MSKPIENCSNSPLLMIIPLFDECLKMLRMNMSFGNVDVCYKISFAYCMIPSVIGCMALIRNVFLPQTFDIHRKPVAVVY